MTPIRMAPARFASDPIERARRHLDERDVDCTCAPQGGVLPLVLTPRTPVLRDNVEAAHAWLARRRGALDALLDEAGAVLLRGFAVPDTAAFRRWIELYPPHAPGYVAGAAPRKAIDGGVFESTRMPPPFRIGLHQEKAYMPDFPRRLAFFCRLPPQRGGETPLCDMRAVTRRLEGPVLERFRARGILYRRNFAAAGDDPPRHALFAEYHRTWRDAFLTNDRDRVAALCRDMRLGCTWLADGSVTVEHTAPATIAHPRTGDHVWFNQASAQHVNERSMGALSCRTLASVYRDRPAWPYEVRHGDGSAMAATDLAPVYDALDAEETAFNWRRGDVLLVDNILVAHGRNPFLGERDIQVAMMD